MRDPDNFGPIKYWIIEIHLVDCDGNFRDCSERPLPPSAQ